MDQIQPTQAPQPHPWLPKWLKYTLAVIATPVVLLFAYGMGEAIYYQATTGTTTAPWRQEMHAKEAAEKAAEHVLPFEQALRAADVHEQHCQYFNVLDHTDQFSTTTLSELGVQVCDFFAKNGGSVIERPLEAGHTAYYPGESSHSGVGIITLDRPYFIAFTLYLDQEERYKVSLTSAAIIRTKHVARIDLTPVQSVVENDKLIRIAGTDETGAPSEEYYGEYYGRYSDGAFSNPVVKNADGTFSKVVSQNPYDIANFSFLVPYSPYVGRSVGDRDYVMEQQNNIRPLYHKAACGLEESYSDVGGTTESVQVGINFGFSPTLYVTTAWQGYVPEQWGKVLKTVPMDDFRSVVREPAAARSNSAAEMLTIGGYQVKHVGPITPDRTCRYQENLTYDMYQAEKNGAVVSIKITHDGKDNVDVSKVITQILGSLTFSRR